MRSQFFRTISITVCIGLLIGVIGQEVQGQQEKPLNLQEIRKTLIFRSRPSKTTEELNEQLIAEIRKRKVNFILSSQEEESLKKAGGSEMLIKTIHEVLPEKTRGKILLYQKYIDNYYGTAEQIKIALEAAKEYVKKFSDDEVDKELLKYFKDVIPMLEKLVETDKEPCYL